MADWYSIRDNEEAIAALRAEGYRITKDKFPEASSVTTPRKLLEYFYARRLFYNPDRRFPHSVNYKGDLKYVEVFLRQREKLGLDRRAAIKEATILIDTLFKYEEHFGLKEPIINPTILSIGFVIDKACAFANGETPVVKAAETEAIIAEMNQKYNRDFADEDARKASTRMTRVLEKLNVER